MTMRPDDHRRKWDKNEYQKLAQERLLNQSAPKEEGNKFSASFAYNKNCNPSTDFIIRACAAREPEASGLQG